jgi:hypothetical protein
MPAGARQYFSLERLWVKGNKILSLIYIVDSLEEMLSLRWIIVRIVCVVIGIGNNNAYLITAEGSLQLFKQGLIQLILMDCEGSCHT